MKARWWHLLGLSLLVTTESVFAFSTGTRSRNRIEPFQLAGWSDLEDSPAVSNGRDLDDSRRQLLIRNVLWAVTLPLWGSGGSPALAYSVSRVEPDEKDTYGVAQQRQPGKGNRPLSVLWVGCGPLDKLSGVYKNLFQTGNNVVAVDLIQPEQADLQAAVAYAADHGYQFRFEQGDATNLKQFGNESFDVVVCSMFLCQDFNPEVVVSEFRRVLKPGGRFGFYEHIEDIDSVIVGKVFGERSVIRVQHYPEMSNIMAGVVRKV